MLMTEAACRRARTALMLGRMVAVALVVACPAAAQDLSPISDMLETIIDALTGPIGVALATIGVFVLGAMLIFSGRITPSFLGAVVVGVVLLFSAATIIDGFDNSGGG